MASEIEKFIDERRQLRKKHFETDGYYKWSDMIDETNYQLRSIIREEIVDLMSYLDEHKDKALPVYTGF